MSSEIATIRVFRGVFTAYENKSIDPKYKIAFDKAIKSGVKILCYDCKLNNEGIKLNKQIRYESWL